MGRSWEVVLDTARNRTTGEVYEAASKYPLEPRSVVVLVRRDPLQLAPPPVVERSAQAEADEPQPAMVTSPQPAG